MKISIWTLLVLYNVVYYSWRSLFIMIYCLVFVLPTTFIRHLDTNMVLSIDCVGINVRIVDSNQLLLLSCFYCWIVWMGKKERIQSLCEQKWFLRMNSKLEHYLRWLDSNKNIPYIPKNSITKRNDKEKKRQSKYI